MEPRTTPNRDTDAAGLGGRCDARGGIHSLPEDFVGLEDVFGRDADAEFDAAGGPDAPFRLTMLASLAQRSAADPRNSA
jgi:hypothetical protein